MLELRLGRQRLQPDWRALLCAMHPSLRTDSPLDTHPRPRHWRGVCDDQGGARAHGSRPGLRVGALRHPRQHGIGVQ